MVCGAGLLTHVGRPAPSNGIHANPASPEHLRVRAISPKAPPRAPARVAAFQVTSTPDGPLGNRSLPGELFGLHPRVLPPTRPHPNTSEVGRFLRKRRSVRLPVLQHSKSPALPTDRSEIGPYLRGLRLRFRGASRPWRERHSCERGRRQYERPIESFRLTPPCRCYLRTYRRGIAAPPARRRAAVRERRKQVLRRTDCGRSSTSRPTR